MGKLCLALFTIVYFPKKLTKCGPLVLILKNNVVLMCGQDNGQDFNTETPGDQADPQHCPVMEQKELGSQGGHQDERCGRDTASGHAGLCE